MVSTSYPLTNLESRASFAAQVTSIYAGQPSPAFAVLVIGMDRFKHINELMAIPSGTNYWKWALNGYELPCESRIRFYVFTGTSSWFCFGQAGRRRKLD